MKYTTTPELLKDLRAHMKADHISVNDLCHRMNKPQSTVSSIWGMNNISLEYLQEICDALGYDLDVEIKKRQ